MMRLFRYRSCEYCSSAFQYFASSARVRFCDECLERRRARRASAYCDALPLAWRAHQKVRRAVVSGQLPRVKTLTCVDCGKPARCYDHRDYTKPLDVAPVCFSCNTRRGPAYPYSEALKAS